jgi:FKBP-type peptidyl-prolyl cis-trans isomerase FkpA
MPKIDPHEQRKAERLARQKRNYIILGVAGAVILAVIAFLIIQGQSNLGSSEELGTVFPLSDDAVRTASGLIYDELVAGEGPEAKAGDTVSFIYTGYLPDGQIFDSNVETGEYREFVLGSGEVIEGWDEGIAGMQVGGARLLVIPPDLADNASDPFEMIPENTTLTYSITLKEIK